MPYIGTQFEIEMTKFDIQVRSCESMNDEMFKKCQTEVNLKQNELIRRLELTDRGSAFLGAKIQVIEANANLVQNSVAAARNTFKQILDLQDPPSLTTDILMAVALSALPVAGAALNPLRQWKNSEQTMQRFAAELSNRSGNISLDILRPNLGGESVTQPIDAFEKALNQAQAELDRATAIRKNFLEQITENKITLKFDVQELWNKQDFGEYAEPITVSYLQLQEFVLYKAFQFYTKSQCKAFVWGNKPIDSVAEHSGDFIGLSHLARTKIYEKFGKNWVASHGYPQIKNLSDLIIHWEPRVVRLEEESKASLSQRGGFF